MNEPETPIRVGSTALLGACVDFIEGKLIDAAATLHAREEMERTWRGGTDEMWRAVGCNRTRAQRLKDADMHGRIAEKNRKEVAMLKAVLERLKAPNDKLTDSRE
jgi:hypothetical protein